MSKFGYFLMEVTLTLVVLICVANVYLQRPVLESFLFSLALAMGLTPQLLPAIAMITLLLPCTPLAPVLGFQPLPIEFLLVLAAIVGLYIFSAENVKRIFYQHVQS